MARSGRGDWEEAIKHATNVAAAAAVAAKTAQAARGGGGSKPPGAPNSPQFDPKNPAAASTANNVAKARDG